MTKFLLIANYACAGINAFQVLIFVSVGTATLALFPAAILILNVLAIKKLKTHLSEA